MPDDDRAASGTSGRPRWSRHLPPRRAKGPERADRRRGRLRGPGRLSRQDLRRQKTRPSRTWRYVLGGVTVALIGMVIGLVVTRGDPAAAPAVTTTSTTARPAAAVAPAR